MELPSPYVLAFSALIFGFGLYGALDAAQRDPDPYVHRDHAEQR